MHFIWSLAYRNMFYSPTIVLFVVLIPFASKTDSKECFSNLVAIFLIPRTMIYGYWAINNHW